MSEFRRDTLVSGSMEEKVAAPPTLVIGYKEFKSLSASKLAVIPPGTLIEGVIAKELFTLQDWVSSDKVLRAARDFVNGRCTTWPIAFPIGLRGKPVLVLGDGTHRSGLVVVNGRLIDVVTESPIRPMDPAKIRPLRAVVNRYRDMFALEV